MCRRAAMPCVSYLDAIFEDFGVKSEKLRLAAVGFKKCGMIAKETISHGFRERLVVSDRERLNFYNLILLFAIFSDMGLVKIVAENESGKCEILDGLEGALSCEPHDYVDQEKARKMIAALRTPRWRSRGERLANPFYRLPVDLLGKSKGYYLQSIAKLAKDALPRDVVDAVSNREVMRAEAFLPQLGDIGVGAEALARRIRSDRDDAQAFDDLLDLLLKK